MSLIEQDAVLIENVEGIARRFVSKPGQGPLSVADDAIARLEAEGRFTKEGSGQLFQIIELQSATAFAAPD